MIRKITLLLILSVLAALLSCTSQREQETAVTDNGVYPDQESWQAVMRVTKDGRTTGLINAGHIQKFSQKKITLMKDSLKVDFFDAEGNHTSVLTSQGGKIMDDRQDMTAYGNVVVVSDSGLTLFTDTLRWNNKEQKIYSDIPVIFISDEGDTLYGDSFKSDPDLVNYEIENPRGKSSKIISIE